MADEIPDLAADDPSFGPSMRALLPQQRKFVLACQMIGGKDNKRAALLAGYGGEGKHGMQVAANAGWRLSHHERVQKAMLEEAGKRIGGLRFRALDVLRDIVDGEKNKPTIKMRAALAILDRTGLPALTEQKMTVTHEVGPQAMILSKIRDMLRINPKMREMLEPPVLKMIEYEEAQERGDVVDAEFTELPKDPDADLLGE
jgi:hypothetical protein